MKKIISVSILLALLNNVSGQIADSLPCPQIKLDVPAKLQVSEGTEALFSVNGFGKSYKKYAFTYNWIISNGTITRGQGTNTIYVNTKGLKGQKIIAIVEVGGFKPGCTNVETVTIDVVKEQTITIQTIKAVPSTRIN